MNASRISISLNDKNAPMRKFIFTVKLTTKLNQMRVNDDVFIVVKAVADIENMNRIICVADDGMMVMFGEKAKPLCASK